MTQVQTPGKLMVYRVWVGNVKSMKNTENGIVIETDENIYEIKVKDQHVEVYLVYQPKNL